MKTREMIICEADLQHHGELTVRKVIGEINRVVGNGGTIKAVHLLPFEDDLLKLRIEFDDHIAKVAK